MPNTEHLDLSVIHQRMETVYSLQILDQIFQALPYKLIAETAKLLTDGRDVKQPIDELLGTLTKNNNPNAIEADRVIFAAGELRKFLESRLAFMPPHATSLIDVFIEAFPEILKDKEGIKQTILKNQSLRNTVVATLLLLPPQDWWDNLKQFFPSEHKKRQKKFRATEKLRGLFRSRLQGLALTVLRYFAIEEVDVDEKVDDHFQKTQQKRDSIAKNMPTAEKLIAQIVLAMQAIPRVDSLLIQKNQDIYTDPLAQLYRGLIEAVYDVKSYLLDQVGKDQVISFTHNGEAYTEKTIHELVFGYRQPDNKKRLSEGLRSPGEPARFFEDFFEPPISSQNLLIPDSIAWLNEVPEMIKTLRSTKIDSQPLLSNHPELAKKLNDLERTSTEAKDQLLPLLIRSSQRERQ